MIISKNGQYICDGKAADHYPDCPMSRSHLAQYELPYDEFAATWRPLQDTIFNPHARYLPDYMFRPELKLCIGYGDGLHLQYAWLVALAFGDQDMLVIENTACLHYPFRIPQIRLKYSVQDFSRIFPDALLDSDLELMEDLSGRNGREFFVFGSSGTWGQYLSSVRRVNTPLGCGGIALRILGTRDLDGMQRVFRYALSKMGYGNLLEGCDVSFSASLLVGDFGELQRSIIKDELPPAYQGFDDYEVD